MPAVPRLTPHQILDAFIRGGFFDWSSWGIPGIYQIVDLTTDGNIAVFWDDKGGQPLFVDLREFDGIPAGRQPHFMTARVLSDD